MPRTGAFASAQLDFGATPSSEIAGRPFETVRSSTQAPPYQRGFFVSDNGLADFDYVYSGSERRVDESDLPGSLKIDYGYTANDKRLADSWLKYSSTTMSRSENSLR